MSYDSPVPVGGLSKKIPHLSNTSPMTDFPDHLRQRSLDDSLDSANTSFSSTYSDPSEDCPTPVIPSGAITRELDDDHQHNGKLTESRKPLSNIRLSSIQLDPSLVDDVSSTTLPDEFNWAPNDPIRIIDTTPEPSVRDAGKPVHLPRIISEQRPANRLRSGSESKAQSLQPVEIECTDGQKVLTICPPLFTVEEATSDRPEVAKQPLAPFEWRPAQELNARNLRILSDLLEEKHDAKSSTREQRKTGGARSAAFADSDEEEEDHVLLECPPKTSEHLSSSANISIVPTISSPPDIDPSPLANGFTQNGDLMGSALPPKRPLPEPTHAHEGEAPLERLPAFFDQDVVLPLPSNYPPSVKPVINTHDTTSVSSGVRISLERLKTMLSKQRKVDFEPEHGDSESNCESFNLNKEATPEEEQESTEDGQTGARKAKARRKLGKVRCTLSKAERMLGVRWIHLVDTSSTTNPNISSEVRYHASVLFSLYWGSRTGKSGTTSFGDKSRTEGQEKQAAGSKVTAQDTLESTKERRKKNKLIAATAMACLTLATKWHFDFCKPLFTVQLRSFCKTTNFGSFKVTPENLIMAERAILFSYPVAGGLWLDSPHAFLEELIHIVPALHVLSSIPEYILRKNYYDVNQSLKYYDEQKNLKDIDADGVWDWPDVMHEFDVVLEKVTTVQEFLAFNPAVFCVIALYLALVEVEPGYYEKNQESRKKRVYTSDPSKPTSESLGPIISPVQDEMKKLVIEEELSELWIWKFIDVNETMNQVCEALEVSARDVEECLNWYSAVVFEEIHRH